MSSTTAHTDTYHGRFVKLVPNEAVVEVDEFETADPTLRGEMIVGSASIVQQLTNIGLNVE